MPLPFLLNKAQSKAIHLIGNPIQTPPTSFIFLIMEAVLQLLALPTVFIIGIAPRCWEKYFYDPWKLVA